MRHPVAVTFVLLLAGPARAQESLDDLDKAKPAASTDEAKAPVAEVNGYLANRLQFNLVKVDTPGIPTTRDVPWFNELLEGNLQLKVHLGSKAFFYADVSFFYQTGGLYYEDDGQGGSNRVDDHDVKSLRPFIVPSELYVSYSPKPWLNLLLGKKRVVWGSGFAFNPTDLINPPKDPTDPNFQRAGSWMARVELPFEKFSVTALWAPQVLSDTSGIPYNVLRYPDYPSVERMALSPPATRPPDEDYHYLAALRLYFLLYNSDINLIYYFSNKFYDGFENKSRFGASFSRYFFTDYELHVEAMFQQGSGRDFVKDIACARLGGRSCPIPTPGGDTTALLAREVGPTKLGDSGIYPRVLLGGRTQFKDESILSIEYYYQADGYSDQEFEDLVAFRYRLKQLYSFLDPAKKADFIRALSGAAPGAASGGLPQRFAFEPLRRHYLIVGYTKPKIRDDWTIGTTLILGLRDLSGLISASVSWNALQWLTLTLYAFAPIKGIPVGQAEIGGNGYNEYSLVPSDFRVLFEVRAYY